MVGIGGAIPSAEPDIRLGDIAVSKPSEKHGGVIEALRVEYFSWSRMNIYPKWLKSRICRFLSVRDLT
jgi:hypothetical protein